MSGLHDTDALAWSEQQAELLRHVASGERINEAVDWPNVIEEIESMGREQLHACESLLAQAMLHLLKLHAQPTNLARRHWLQEIDTFLGDAMRRYSPSMRQRIDLQAEYARAVRRITLGQAEPALPKLPETCPWTLDDLLTDPPDLATLVATLDTAAAS